MIKTNYEELDKNGRRQKMTNEEWINMFINKFNESKDYKITDIRDREKLLDDLRPTGEWIEGEYGNIKCNQCGCEIRYSYLIGNKPEFPKFCCDCGAKMKGGAKNEISN